MNTPFYVGVALSLFGLYFLKYAVTSYKNGIGSHEWSKIQGKLIKSELWGNRNIDGKMVPAKNLSVEYKYEIDGTVHSGRRVTFYTLMYPETVEFSQSNTLGDSIEVYYDPKNHKESVLVPGLRESKRFSDVIIAIAATLVGLGLSVAAFMGLL